MNIKMNKTIRLSAILATTFAFVGVGIAQTQTVASASNTPDTPTATAVKAEQASTSPTTGKGFQDRHPRYKIAAGDAFDVAFELNPEFDQTVTVQPDGFVTLRGIGDVQVQNQTVPELTETIRGAYSKILNDPMVSIVLKDFQKPYFIADGQIGKPGKYELRGETTLTEAIAIAGGFTDTSKHSQVVLFRKAANGWYTGDVFDVKKMERTKNLHEDPQLQPGDMLFVPKSRYGKIRMYLPGSSMGAFVPLAAP